MSKIICRQLFGNLEKQRVRESEDLFKASFIADMQDELGQPQVDCAQNRLVQIEAIVEEAYDSEQESGELIVFDPEQFAAKADPNPKKKSKKSVHALN